MADKKTTLSVVTSEKKTLAVPESLVTLSNTICPFATVINEDSRMQLHCSQAAWTAVFEYMGRMAEWSPERIHLSPRICDWQPHQVKSVEDCTELAADKLLFRAAAETPGAPILYDMLTIASKWHLHWLEHDLFAAFGVLLRDVYSQTPLLPDQSCKK